MYFKTFFKARSLKILSMFFADFSRSHFNCVTAPKLELHFSSGELDQQRPGTLVLVGFVSADSRDEALGKAKSRSSCKLGGFCWSEMGKHHFLHFQMVQRDAELQQSTDVNRQLITHLFNKMYSAHYLSSEPITNYTVHHRALINKI